MSRLHQIPDREIVARLRHEGWEMVRQRGSHQQWRNPQHPHRRVTTTTTKMTGNIRRSVFRQAGWQWVDHDVDIDAELRSQCAALQRENEELRIKLWEALRLVDLALSGQRMLPERRVG